MDMRDGAAIAEAEASYLHVEVVLIWNVWRETDDWENLLQMFYSGWKRALSWRSEVTSMAWKNDCFSSLQC